MPITISSFTSSPVGGYDGTNVTVSWAASGAAGWSLYYDGQLLQQGSGSSGSRSVLLTPPSGGWGSYQSGRVAYVELVLSNGPEEVRRRLPLYIVKSTQPGSSGADPISSDTPMVYGVSNFLFTYQLVVLNNITEEVLLKTPDNQWYTMLSGSIPIYTRKCIFPVDSNGHPVLLTVKPGTYFVYARITGQSQPTDIIGTVTVPGVNDPPTASLSANPPTGVAPYAGTISWSVSGSSDTQLRLNGGAWSSVPNYGSYTITVSSPVLVELKAANPNGTTNRTASFTPAAPPVIDASVTPGALYGPGQAVLAWSITDADSATLNGQPVALSGSQTIQIQNASQAGLYSYQFNAVRTVNSLNLTSSRTVTLDVTWPPNLEISTPGLLPEAETVRPYSFQLQGSGGFGNPAQYVWTLESGSLPPGLSLSSSGLISGTPLNTQTAEYVFRVRLSDDGLDPAFRDFTLRSVKIHPVSVSAPAVVAAKQLQNVSIPVQASGGYGSYVWTVSGLPAGFVFQPNSDGSGVVTGLFTAPPSAVHLLQLEAQSISSDGQVVLSGTAQVSLQYTFYPVAIVTPVLPTPRSDETWTAQIGCEDGLPPYVWTVAGLPEWASYSQNGAILTISGQPGQEHEGNQLVLTVTVTDDVNGTAQRVYTLTVARGWAYMDPFHTVFYRVLDSNGQPVPGMTNDPYPNDPKIALARLVVGFTVGVEDVTVEDIRRRGGGLLEEHHSIPEADHFWDVGFLDGRPWPMASMALVLLPPEVRRKMPDQQLMALLEGSLPMGCIPVVRYYSGASGWSEDADF